MNLKGRPVNTGKVEFKASDKMVYQSGNQLHNFIECMRTRKPTINPLESAIRSDTISHLSDIAIRLERTIRWDPQKEKVLDDTTASEMLDRPMRSPYSI